MIMVIKYGCFCFQVGMLYEHTHTLSAVELQQIIPLICFERKLRCSE
jgi:hypothetical protein